MFRILWHVPGLLLKIGPLLFNAGAAGKTSCLSPQREKTAAFAAGRGARGLHSQFNQIVLVGAPGELHSHVNEQNLDSHAEGVSWVVEELGFPGPPK